MYSVTLTWKHAVIRVKAKVLETGTTPVGTDYRFVLIGVLQCIRSVNEKWLSYVIAKNHSTLQEYIAVILKPMLPTMKVGRLSTQDYTSLEVSSCIPYGGKIVGELEFDGMAGHC